MIIDVIGARPNFMKIAPVFLEGQRAGLKQILVHTGQHYDVQMSSIFFQELGLPRPDIDLGVGSGSHAEQTARILTSFESVCIRYKPRLVVVGGDVNSTLACALAAAKLDIPIAHVEAGLRSFDRTMPEEINRVLTDHLSSLLFTTEPSGEINLREEGVDSKKIHFVGNTMIDSLQLHLPKALSKKPWKYYGFQPGEYGVVTLHRPSNVDHKDVANELARALEEVAKELPLIFPIHPRTLQNSNGVWSNRSRVRIVEPLGYLEFLGLMAKARVVITDSGGIQEETTALGVPCVTVRHNTERPVTLTMGTNRLVRPIKDDIVQTVQTPLKRQSNIPELWDGKAAVRIVEIIQKKLG